MDAKTAEAPADRRMRNTKSRIIHDICHPFFLAGMANRHKFGLVSMAFGQSRPWDTGNLTTAKRQFAYGRIDCGTTSITVWFRYSLKWGQVRWAPDSSS